MPLDGTAPELKPRGAPPRDVVPSAWVDTVAGPTWTVATVRAAISALEGGDFYGAAQLSDAALRDCVVLGSVNTRVRALSSRYALPFCVEEGTGDGRRLEAIRKRVEELWWDAIPERVVSPVLRDAIMPGAAIGTIGWDTSGSEWIPRLYHLPVHGLEFDESTQNYYYNDRSGTRSLVTPGDGRWFLHLPHGRRSFMWGAIRAIGEPWIERRFARRDRARWCERHGMPVLKVKEPYFASDDVVGPDGKTTTKAQEVYTSIRSGMVSGAVIRCPQSQSKDEPGWDAEFLELEGKSFDGFMSALEDAAKEIEIALLGRARDAGAKGGDGELASETQRNENLASDAEALATTIRDQVWKPYVAFNYGVDMIDAAPWGRWDTRPAPNRKSRAETLDTLADALGKLAALGVDTTKILEEFGLEAPEGVEAPAPPPPAAPAQAA